MPLLSFELSMPNRGSWNNQWSGQDRKHYVIRKVSARYLKSQEHFKTLVKNLNDSWRYSWSDGWAASVKVQIVNSAEATKRRKASSGFCGYDWMIDSILHYGEIMNSAETKLFLQKQVTA